MCRGQGEGPRWGRRCGQLRWESGHWSGWGGGARGQEERCIVHRPAPHPGWGPRSARPVTAGWGHGCPQGPASRLWWAPGLATAGLPLAEIRTLHAILTCSSALPQVSLKPITRPISPGLPPPLWPPRLPEGTRDPRRPHPPRPPSSLHPTGAPAPAVGPAPFWPHTPVCLLPLHGHPRLSLRAAFCTALPIGPNLPVGPTSVDWFCFLGPRRLSRAPGAPGFSLPGPATAAPRPPAGRGPLPSTAPL